VSPVGPPSGSVDATETVPGRFAFPGDVATTVSVPSAGGRVRATVTANGATAIKLLVSCPGALRRTSGGDKVTSTVSSEPGKCTITVRDDAAVPGTAVPFTLRVRYPMAATGTNPR
jgi:hypothetical protein